MRPFEFLLVIANLLTPVWLTVPLPRPMGWLRFSAPAALLTAAAQTLAEGPRWQMIPAYALAGAFFLVWLQQTIARSGKASERKRANRLASGIAIGMGALGLAASVVLPIVLPVFRLPQPTGAYEIGTLTYNWVDVARPEVFSSDPEARRELMVQIWYPAQAGFSSPRATYVQDASVLIPLARMLHLPDFKFGHMKYVSTHAVTSAHAANDKPNYPVLIFLEGATGFRQMNTFQVEELVSHGYIVAAIDQPYTAELVVFPDGRRIVGLPFDQMKPLIRQSHSPAEQAPVLNGKALEKGIVPYLAQDVAFTLDRLAALNHDDPNAVLTGRLDLRHAGILGVSLGGIAGSEACRVGPRLRACLIMDAPMPVDVVKSGLDQPAMWITRDAETMRLERRKAGGWSETDISEHQTTMRAAFANTRGGSYFVQVPGMFHLNLTDVPDWSPALSWLGIVGPINAERAHGIVNTYSLAFFDRHLKGRQVAFLDGKAKLYLEVIFESRGP